MLKIPPRGPAFVFSITRIGDLAFASLTFDALASRTNQRLVLVVDRGGAPLVAQDPRVARLRVVRTSHAVGWRIAVVRALLDALRARGLVVNLEVFAPRWRFIHGLTWRMGLTELCLDLDALRRDQRAVTNLGAPPTATPHMSRYYARALGIEDEPPPKLHVDGNARVRMRARLDRERLHAGRLVVVHPGASEGWTAKRAPIGFYAGVLTRVAARCPISVVAVGTKAETAATMELCGTLPADLPRASWAGSLPLADLPALLAEADLFVGNDSGPLRVAEAVNAPTLSFWGPTPPEILAPRGPRHRAVRTLVSCHPCFLMRCSAEVHCMTQIAEREASSHALEILRSTGG